MAVLHDQELGAGERLAHARAVRQRHDRVGGRDDQRAHAAVEQRVGQLGRGEPGSRRHALDRHAPVRGDRRAIVRVVHAPVARQQVRQPADLAAAHRVRLAGQRQRPATRPPEVAGREAEVDQRAVLQRPDGRLVRAHRPQRHRRARAGEPLGGADDVRRGDAADRGGARRRPPPRDGERLVEPARVALDERAVHQPLGVDHREHRAQVLVPSSSMQSVSARSA
jgi:hypothetical protein